MSCMVYDTVKLPDGSPASFASVTVYEVRRFLWWEYDAWVMSKTADYYGRVSYGLIQGRKYRFVYRHGSRRADLWRTLDYCPIYAYVTFPR